MRPEYQGFWDFRICLDVLPELALTGGIDRDARREGTDEAERVHRDRFHAAELIYIDEIDQRSKADWSSTTRTSSTRPSSDDAQTSPGDTASNGR